eukprot:TRINITY_DN26603_c0_g1_i1.p1 TRINITY_DN26603_c0_g1~~TRINITY_DN26603_c0_g1_i1.p1  ORF type:complete len:580 (+),score=66.29 TRINITY_DN26603_c0_g1_i1:105-1844(+)
MMLRPRVWMVVVITAYAVGLDTGSDRVLLRGNDEPATSLADSSLAAGRSATPTRPRGGQRFRRKLAARRGAFVDTRGRSTDGKRFGASASSGIAGPIVASNFARPVWWGFPNYQRFLDTGSQTWSELRRRHGHLSRTCTTATAKRDCGTAFVCRNEVCSECTVSRECGDKYRCEVTVLQRSVCVERDIQTQWNWGDVVCTLGVVITALFSAAAGMGGGSVYVPLLLLLLGFSTQEAMPVSQMMIAGGAVVNLLFFCGESDPLHPGRPKIDYDVIMMLNPGLSAGVTIGIMANSMSPQWVIVLTLIVTLVIGLQKSLDKGMNQWKKESKMLEKQGNAVNNDVKVKMCEPCAFLALAPGVWRQLFLIGGCSLLFLMMNMMKAPQCSAMYWTQQLGMLVFCVAFTSAGAKTLGKKVANDKDTLESEDADMLVWSPRALWFYPLLATTAGFLGGFLGIGGGVVLGPLLLELGMRPENSQATSATFVFLSSSLASLQFILMGKAMPGYAVWFTSWVIVATIVGQTLIDYLVRRWQRASLIVLSVAAIIAGSLVMMSIVGVMDVIADIRRGANDMGFAPHKLCQR